MDIWVSPEYIIFGTDYDFATEELILLIKSTMYIYLEK